MKKYRKAVLGILALAAVLAFGGCKGTEGTEETKGKEAETVRTFADWTDCAFFQEVPVMLVDKTEIGEAVLTGVDVYTIDVNGTTVEDYWDYVTLLTENGFVKHSDNGAEGLDGDVYNASLFKDELVLNVVHLEKLCKTYITAWDEFGLSEHLVYDEAFAADNQEGAQTTLHMQETIRGGNSFVIRLKNGHFILNDGGTPDNAKYLLDYLYSLVDKGEVPVVEAWFVSHAHDDHDGFFTAVADDISLTEKIFVEGIYFCSADVETSELYGVSESHLMALSLAFKCFKNTLGEQTPVYRPSTGQKYYFSDIVVDVVQTCDMLPVENYYMNGDLNEASMCLMYHIEDQAWFCGGDYDIGAFLTMSRTYDREYLLPDIYTAPHHGHMWENTISDYIEADVVLYPYYGTLGIYDGYQEACEVLNAKAEEVLSYGGGTVVLTFPYEAGSAEVMPGQQWIYHDIDDIDDYRDGRDTTIIYNTDGTVKRIIGETEE